MVVVETSEKEGSRAEEERDLTLNYAREREWLVKVGSSLGSHPMTKNLKYDDFCFQCYEGCKLVTQQDMKGKKTFVCRFKDYSNVVDDYCCKRY